MPRLTIQNEGRTFDVAPNANLRKAILEHQGSLYPGPWKWLNCRGRGFCGSCEVLVIEGAEHLTERTPAEHRKLKTWDVCRRLSCQCAIIGDAHVVVNSLP